MAKKIKSITYAIEGMHCASCEIVIEKKLLEIVNVKSAEVSIAKNQAVIAYQGEQPTLKKLNQLFKPNDYVFLHHNQVTRPSLDKKDFLKSLGIGITIIIVFLSLNRLGISGFVNISTTSSLPMFFVLGLVAGISSCAALVGGIILSMSKQWEALFAKNDSTWERLQPHLSFNLGRIMAYGILGALLGTLGSQLNFSLSFGSILVLIVSGLMIILGLQMLGVKSLRKFQLTMPKSLTKYIADETNFQNRFMPAVMGALTFFLPCGFTITAQGLALISGSAMQGGLIMLLFALGTAPSLLFIGLSSIKLSQKPHLADKFTKVAGFLVLFFAIYNINFQLNVLGLPSLNDLNTNAGSFLSQEKNKSAKANEENLVPMINGKQMITMEVSSYGYNPNFFKIRTNVPVKWEVTDKGMSGCTNAIIARGLFDGEFPLQLNETSVKEFTPKKPGTYKFSCWMGMVSGIIEVVD